MKYELHSYRHALDIVESTADLKELWNEVESCLKSISDDDIINNFMNRGLKRGKSISEPINELIRIDLVEKGWTKESKIFNEIPYTTRQAGMKYFRLDFSKEQNNKGFAIEVSFNHREALAWNLLKPTLSSELNHVKKAIQTDIGIIILPKEEMVGHMASGLDNAVGTYELVLKYLKVLNAQLTCPMIIVGLNQPSNFCIDTESERGPSGAKLGTVIKR